MAKTGYKIVVYLDDNPLSPTYMQTYEERVLDETSCPISEDDLVLISNECEVSISGYTGYRLEIYYNRTTGEYVENRVLDSECEASSTEEQWVNSGSPYCETTEKGINTGYMLQLQVQMNPNLANYGETRTQRYKSPECGGNNCAIWEDIQKQCHIEVIDCVATFDGTADISQIDNNPLSDTYNQTRTINKQDSDCENCTQTTFSWLEVGTMCGDDELLCSNGIQQTSTNSYTVTQKYKTIGNKTIPMDEYQVVLKTEDDEDCGYIRPQYKMEKAEGQYLCDYETYTKYEMLIRMVSYDAGVTWSIWYDPQTGKPYTERGEVIAYDSYDCGKPMYRWIPNGEFMCEDNGDDGKLMIWNNESKLTAYTPCDESNVLSGSEATIAPTKEVYSEYANTKQVGDCVSVVNGLSVDNSYKLWLGNYTEEINGGLGSYERTSLDIPSRVNYFNGGFPSDSSRWNSYLRTMVFHSMTPPTLGSLSGYTRSMPLTVTNQPYGITYNSGIFVPKDAYNDYLDAWSYTTFTNLIKPMNDDSISYKAIVRYESDFSTWSWYVPDGESADTIDYYEAAYGSANIVSITISDKVRTIKEGAFYRSQNYTSFGAKQLDLGNGVQTIGPYAFKSSQFTDIYIPSSVRTIDYESFGSGALTSLTIANGVQTIGDSAFKGHKLSGTIEIPDSVQTIGSNTFKGNQYSSNIEHIIIGSGCTEIGDGAFYQNHTNNVCPLKTVTVKALTPPRIYSIGSDYCGQYNTVFSAFYNKKFGSNYCNFPYGNYTIYVPCEAYEDYLEDPYWRYFLKGDCTIEPYGCSEEEVTIAVLHQTDGTDININKPINAKKILKSSDISPYTSTTSSITVNSNCTKIQGVTLYTGTTLSEVTFNGVTPPTFQGFINWGVSLYVPCESLFAYYDILDEADYIHPSDDSCMEESWVNDFDCENRYTKYITINGESRSTHISSGYCADINLNGFIQEDENTFVASASSSMNILFQDCGEVPVDFKCNGGSYNVKLPNGQASFSSDYRINFKSGSRYYITYNGNNGQVIIN